MVYKIERERFQLDIKEADIKSNADIFYIEEYTKNRDAQNVLFLRTRDPFRVLWGDKTYTTNTFSIDEDIQEIKNLLDRGAIVVADIKGYTEELRKTSPKTAQYLDLRLEELYELYKPKNVVR